MTSKQRALNELNRRLSELDATREEPPRQSWMRRYRALLHKIFKLYEETVTGRKNRPGLLMLSKSQANLLRRLAAKAFDDLGGQPEPALYSLKHYDHVRFGPYLGVSGEGEAAPAIRGAALTSPKVRALSLMKPIEIGVAHDAERLGSVGELPVGPDEYRDIRLECLGRILTSTNIGARINLRFYAKLPVVWVNDGPLHKVIEQARGQAKEHIAPFLRTPDQRPRPLTVYVQFRARVTRAVRLEVLRTLAQDFTRGKIGIPDYHKVGLLAKVQRGTQGMRDVKEAIDLAHCVGVSTVAIEGIVRAATEDMVSMPGLLQYFNPAQTQILLEHAMTRKIRLTPKNIVDTETVARQVYAGLALARNMGLELGKYGLFPLTFEECEEVVCAIQRWFSSWTAAPVFYVDVPMVMRARVFTLRESPEAIRLWLRMVARHRIPVVLIDTLDKSKGRRLMKASPRDGRGMLRPEEILALDRFAQHLGIKTLWAGGISLSQVYEFGRMNVFGIYVTSAAATTRPVTTAHEHDMALAAERIPTRDGVAQVKLLLEAGFLSERLATGGWDAESKAIKVATQHATQLLGYTEIRQTRHRVAALQQLDKLVLNGWRKGPPHFSNKGN